MSDRENCHLRSFLGVCSPMHGHYCEGKCLDIDDEVCTALQDAYAYGEAHVIKQLKKDMEELAERLQKLMEREEETNKLMRELAKKWGTL